MSPINFVKIKPDSARDLEDIARKLLRAAGVKDQLPTPKDDIIDCAELVVGGEINLDDFKVSLFNKFGKALYSGWKKLKGILDVRERTIYINSNVPESQKPFLTFHEVAHNVIPWQTEVYKYFGDDNYTLSPVIKNKFEKEANHLSATLLFQVDRFEIEARDYELSIKSGIRLASKYGASFHSTLWHYAETNLSKCILLILKECNHNNLNSRYCDKSYRLIYTVPSKKFLKEFGVIDWKKIYGSKHDFTAIVNDSTRPEIFEGELELENIYGEKILANFEAWYNFYNIFILIRKKPKISLLKKRVLFHQ